MLHRLNTDKECYTTLTSCLFLYGRCSRMEPLSRARNYFRDVRTPTRLHARCYLIQQMLQGKLTSHIRYYNVTSHSRLQRRIQDFPEATYNLATFRQKLHENEENWTGGASKILLCRSAMVTSSCSYLTWVKFVYVKLYFALMQFACCFRYCVCRYCDHAGMTIDDAPCRPGTVFNFNLQDCTSPDTGRCG